MIKICLIDNYDSFTYNVFHYFAELGCNVTVLRNDKFKINDLKKFDKIVISPGPGNPDSAGLCLELLGNKIITQALGGKIIKAKKLMHGKTSKINIFSSKIFKDMPNIITGTRYHSLVADPERIPESLKITAITNDGVIMGLSHEKYDVHGIQFHPESIKTIYGKKIIKNFLKSR
jgi:anthranilate/para-aminobenzoate synthase component II